MPTNVISMTYEEWFEAFRPMKNPVNPDAPYDGYLVNTNANEMAWLAEHNRAKVWTLLESEGAVYISEGWRFINRLGYFVTEVPRLRDGEFYDITVYDADDEDEGEGSDA